MKFAFYQSLIPAARKAFDKGTGTHGRFIVAGKYMALRDKPDGWFLVIKGQGEVVREVRA